MRSAVFKLYIWVFEISFAEGKLITVNCSCNYVRIITVMKNMMLVIIIKINTTIYI